MAGTCPRCGGPLPEDGSGCSCGEATAGMNAAPRPPISGGAGSPAAGDSPSDLRVGAVIAGRYRLLRFIGRGGMGQVFEVEDLELGERVALKLLLPELLADPTALARFRREIRLARKVSHPNVCRVFDVGKLELDGPAGSRREMPFLTMALLEGETLAERLRRHGRMTTAEALPLVEQMAAALAAAHEVGVVHRDFKPANVILVQSSLGERAVVTDFGLAVGAGSDTALTGTGVVGTPAYMAPEQVSGSRVTAAADVYALGLVMFEMLTGQRAFDGGTAMEVAIRRLTAPAPSPASIVPDLDPTWDRAVSRCLEREPAARFASAAEVVKGITGESLAASPALRRKRRWRLAAVILAPMVALAAVAGFIAAKVLTRPTGVAAPTRRAVAVLGFRNLSGAQDAAWLSTALAESLGLELAVGERLERISGEEVARLKGDLGLADGGTLGRDTLASVRSRTGADLTISGSYLALPVADGRTLRLNLTVQSTSTGGTVCELVEEGRETELLQLLARTGAQLRERLEVGGEKKQESSTGLVSNVEANQLYAEGLALLRSFDAGGAVPLLERAVALAPDFALARAALARGLADAGQGQKAAEEARQALAAAGGLPREERLLIEGQCHELGGDMPRAIEVYRSLRTLFPDDVEHGIRLGEAQVTSGDNRGALATVAELRSQLPAPRRDDPRLDLIEARAAYFLSDFRHELEAAQRGEAKAKETGSRLVLARALDIQGSAYRNLGSFDRAEAALEGARRLYAEVGSQRNLARVRNSVAALRYDQGDLEGAVAAYREAVAISRQLGGPLELGGYLHNLAFVLYQRGDGGEALELATEAVAQCEKVGRKAEVGEALRKLAMIQLDQGRIGAAAESAERALALSHEVGRRWSEEVALEVLAAIALDQDRLELAQERLDAAASLCRQLLGDDSPLPPATRILQARLAAERGNLTLAEALCRGLEEDLKVHPDRELLRAAAAIEASVLLAQRRAGEALAALERAGDAVAGTPFVRGRLDFELVRGEVETALGRYPAGATRLAAVQAEASRRNMVPLRLEAQLAQAKLELARGDVGARDHLAAVAAEAAGLGFTRIAREAKSW